MNVRYITIDEVLAYHQRLLEDQGQPPAPLIAREKLESAVLRPQTEAFGEELFTTLAEKAAALLQGITIAHAFLDGNKRAAAAAMLLFLELNGVGTVPDQDELYDLVIAVTTGELREVDDIAPKLAALFALE